mmetsp:Transcript_36977/g.55873  ORF Transcript_36977/g.55873 Transcript_36977/m.55873 type:complete len:247 (-) Transcript_36977:55-795(-)
MCVFVQPPHCATNNEDEKLQNGSRHRAPLKSRATFVESLHLTIGLCHSLNLILLLDGIAVGGLLGSIHDLVGKALGNGLDVTEGAVSRTSAEEVDGLVHSTEGRDIHSLPSNDAGRTDSGGVLSGAPVLDSIDVHLKGVHVRQEVDNLEGMLHDADGHHFLTVVPAVHHHGAAQSLHDRAQGLSELLLLVSASSVRQEGHGVHSMNSDVVLEGQVTDVDIAVAPAAEELDLSTFRHGECGVVLVSR